MTKETDAWCPGCGWAGVVGECPDGKYYPECETEVQTDD